jgi:hypothetical protein
VKRASSIIIILALSFVATAIHDFHVSITKIDLNPETKKLEVMIKLFTDDLSTALDAFTGKALNLGTQKEPPSANDELKKYVESGFEITINGKPVVLNYLGKQQEDDATWVYLESGKQGKVKQIGVVNSLLTERFDDQANLINLNINDEKDALTLRKGQTGGKVEFD